MDEDRLAKYRGYAEQGPGCVAPVSVLRDLLDYVAELEEWQRDAARVQLSDAKLVLFLYERLARLLTFIQAEHHYRSARLVCEHTMPWAAEGEAASQVMHEAREAFEAARAALKPGDMGEAP